MEEQIEKRYGKGVFVLLIAALVSAGGIGAACFFTQAGEKSFKEETEMLKAESGYLESGAPEKAGPYPEEQSKSGKKEKRKPAESAGYRNCRRERTKGRGRTKKKKKRKNREKRQSSG